MSQALSVHRPLLNVSVTPGRRVSFCGDEVAVQLLVNLRPQAKAGSGDRPVDLRFVIDRSGSMSEPSGDDSGTQKVRVVCAGIAKVVEALSDADRAMLITFNQAVEVNYGLQPMHARARQAFAQTLGEVKADGSTRFSEAIELAMRAPTKPGTLTRLVFLTDGESTCNPSEDHEGVGRLTRLAREKGIPWLIYGTGINYNWSFLEQVAHQGAPGAFIAHVMDVATLENHLIGEIAFLRGVAIDHLAVEGTAGGNAAITSATRFMPVHGEVSHDGASFNDASGALDVCRGQQYLIELVVRHPRPGMRSVFALVFRGRSLGHGFAPFEQRVDIPVFFTDDPQQVTAPNAEVVRVLQIIAARKLARDGKLKEAADLSERAGDTATTAALRTLIERTERGQTHAEDAGREATTVVDRSTTTIYTQAPPKKRG